MPECINEDKIYENGIYYYKKIFMINKSKSKSKKPINYNFEFIIGEDKYIISFDNKDNTFIYDVDLKVGKKIIDIFKNIDQSKIEYNDKMQFFIEALEQRNEKSKTDDLFKDTIALYSKKKGFSLLISLFLKIYERKDLCSELLKLFKDMNKNPKDNEKNMDRKACLKNYTEEFNEILSKSDSYDYDKIEFYGLLLCYFNYYDYENFDSILLDLFKKSKKELFEILLIYNAHFKYPIKQDFKFIKDFIQYAIKKEDFAIFQCGLNYIKDLVTFIDIMEINKEEMFNLYTQKDEKCIIKLDDNLKFQIVDKEEAYNLDNENSTINKIIRNIKSIIEFCENNNTFLIYFTNNFWKYILNYFNEPTQDNISICYELRKLFLLYYDLVIKKFEKKPKKFTIKNEVINYFEIDEFAFLLDQMIKKHLSEKKDLESIEKLAYITKYNPYYTDSKYYNQVSSDIFDLLDLNNIDDDFIEHFREMNFELIFKENISEYINKIFSKINNISDFDTIIDLINIERLEDKTSFLDSVKKKYDKIITNDVELLKGKELNKAIKVISKLSIINFIFEEEKKKFYFVDHKLKKLGKSIIPLIYIEIIRQCMKLEENTYDNFGEQNDEESKFKKLKDYIFDKFANKLDDSNDIDNIIKLINCLEGHKENIQKDKSNDIDDNTLNEQGDKRKENILNEFLKKLIEKNLFTKEEYFSRNKNLKIELLYKLYENGKIKKNVGEYYDKIQNLIKSIKQDLDGQIKKKTLEDFLSNNESFIKQRLSLINLIIDVFKPDETFKKLNKINDDINKEIKKLIFIKENIIIYHGEVYEQIIKRLIEIIDNNQNKKISDYKGGKDGKGGNIHEFLNEIKSNNLEDTANKVDSVKKFLLFNVIYEMNQGKDEEKNFNDAYNELNEIGDEIKNIGIIKLYEKYKKYFDKIREKLSNNEDRAKDFIKDFMNHYKIKDKMLENGLIIIFKSKKFELDINSMIFFFGYFQTDNKDWNDKLSPEKYQNLSKKKYEEIKKRSEELRRSKIYDYNNIKNYNKLFTCLYDKREAIDFLFSKKVDDMNILKDRIQPNDRILSVNDIEDTERCIVAINRMKKLKDNNKIFKYIMAMNDEIIGQFENYSKIYSSVIELDRNDDISENIYEQVNNIIKDATFNILQDYEEFFYYDEKSKKHEPITTEELIHLKNKIHNENIKGNEDDKIKAKCKILIFFKNLVSNLEIINEYMDVLRTKGSSLPIKISIKINKIEDKEHKEDSEPTIKYFLADKLMEFKDIRDFLFNAKNKYTAQLDAIYKKDLNIRFLFGKQFRSLMKHIKSNLNIDSFLRFILNNKNNNQEIKEGYKAIQSNATDYVKFYELYNQNSLDSISKYITTLFNHNHISVEQHYNEMRIITGDDKVYKGIFLHECENNSMEEFILNLYWDKIKVLPIAQNVLITNKETSSEEIQAFFHRAILCNYNTLYIIELNDSFNIYQQSIMNSYLDKLLTIKNETYNEGKDENIEKKNTQIYLDSCIVFVYDKSNKNITSFINEIEKLDIQHFENISNIDKNNRFLSELNNIKVITSDICGLGKSEIIKKTILDKNKKYFHFPLGGILTKDIIFNKLDKLLKKIKNEDYKKVAIHLDLTESKEKSIINEFFFSFLVTKFYTNNESIIYIPQDIDIYIEIPNCFIDYLSKFRVLNIFNKENITLQKMPKFNYSNETTKIFKRTLGLESNEDIQKFVEKNIGKGNYSYHQINIFIRLFISQYSKLNFKFSLSIKGKDITKDFIEQFARCTQYFTNGSFAKLLTSTDKNKDDEQKDYIDILSEVYKNDLDNMKFKDPLIYIIKEKLKCEQLQIPDHDSKEYKGSKDYLASIKKFLDLPNDVEKGENGLRSLLSIIEEENNNYVITNDNFRKMILLVYRIKANIPVIIMGDTGCGKTALIIKLNQILNNGENKVEIINIHPGITDDKLCEIMKEKNEIAEKRKDEELWVFFDEINTCLSLSLLTEIFINRSYNGNSLHDNIRLIGACNPYIKRNENSEKYGLSMSDDKDNDLVYLVEPLPQSLLYYVFSFGSIDENDEKKYIQSIIEPLFSPEESYLHKITTEAISQCHIYLRKKFGPSVVSLREIARFSKCIKYFQNYFSIKNKYENRNNNEKNNKLRSIICTIYLNYYIRLTDAEVRTNFDFALRPILLNLVNNSDQIIKNEGGDLMDQIKNDDFRFEIKNRPEEYINDFSDFLKIEEEYVLNQIELDEGIGKNTLLKENVFLLFLSVNTNIPFIIIGKPGSGKSLSAQLINKSMRGKYSKNKFFQQFPQIIQTYFQGSESTQPEDVENLFEKAKKKLDYFKNKDIKKEELPISLVLFDELGLAERSKSNPLKVLHSKLEYTGKDEGLSFVGISNYSLDAAKINRALVSSVPDLDQKLGDLIETSGNIVESISDKLKNDQIFQILSKTYFNYKNELQTIKELVTYKQYVNEQNNNKNITMPKVDNQKQFENDKTEDKAVPKITEISETKDDKLKGIEDLKEGQQEANQENPDVIKLKEDLIKNNKSVSEGKTQNDGYTIVSESEEKNNDLRKEKKREKRQFKFIKEEKEFIYLLKKENKIRKDFHGNRDFYNLIKGIAKELAKKGESNDKDKVSIVIRYIERNFGGIDYEIDVDLNLILDDNSDDIKKLRNILEDYDLYDEKKKTTKLPSVFLFKKIYNFECEDIDPNSKLRIEKDKLNDYNLNRCIYENIKDENSRYLLLKIKPSLTRLIYQKIKLQHPFKNIKLYDGSPFENDNNKEYRFKKINEIQDDAKDDKLIIIENLDQIHPFLFDLYNMNYIIKDEKKFARICLEVFNEQLTLVNDKFRIIILVNRRFVDNCNLAFLNRLEKMNLTFNKLLDNQLKRIAENIIKDIKLKNTIKKYKRINFSLRDLLINSEEEEIQGLVYYFSQESKKNDDDSNDDLKEVNVNEEQLTEQLKEKVLQKIYKILPQDIISVLSEDNIIRKKYCDLKNIYNFKDYINDEETKKYKISIIYTYTGITNIVTGLNKGMSFMVSELKSENGLKNLINEIKIKNENNKNKEGKTIFIKFEQSNSEKIKFISNFILSNLMDDEYNYIITMHINRNFNVHNNKEKIYSLPDIYPEINQLFIDNLNGNNKMKLNYFLTRDIKEILEEKRKDLNLDDEFSKTLKKYLKNNLNKKSYDENMINDYINEIQTYLNDEESIKEKIFEITYKLIDQNKDEETNCKEIIDEIYNNKYITIYTIDIVSCLIEYIIENIFNKYLEKVFEILEDNNILTTLLEIKKNNFENISKNLVEEIINKYLDEIIKIKNYKRNPKFLFNYNIPGFYNFYVKISEYVNKTITLNYANNEKKLRKLAKATFDKMKEFNDIEESLLNNTYDEVKNNDKYIFELINKIPYNLILQDYLTYYLQKHENPSGIYKKDDISHKMIDLLLKLRFDDNYLLLKGSDNINNLLLRIIWIESNVNYILNTLKILKNALMIFNNNENNLFNSINELIFKEKNLRYITNEKKNPEHTKIVNECFYVLLASICYVITSDEIQLIEIIDSKNENEIDLEYYSNILIEINKILQFLNDDLRIFLNEMYIIDELIKIIDLIKNNNNIEKINKIKSNLRENAFIIQKYANIDNDELLSEKLINNFEDLYSLIIKDEIVNKNNKEYFDKLRYIFYKEIKKISDVGYRYKIFEKILEFDEIIKKSNDIFQILLKKVIKKEEFDVSRNNLLNSEDNLIKLFEKYIINNNFVLSETLLYFFEKNSLIYLNYILNDKEVKLNLEDDEVKDKKDKIIKGPLQIFKDCIQFLQYYISKPEKFESKSKEICKLFCLGYIRVYCFTFINMVLEGKPDIKESKIFDVINGKESLFKMIRLYLYKILFNKKSIYVFIDQENFKKYKLNEFIDLKKLLQNNDFINIYKIDNKIKTLNEEYYKQSNKVIEKYKKDAFKNEIKERELKIDEIGIDNFYVASYNSTLANLQMENSDVNKDFYNNICLPLFKKDTLLFKAISLFYDSSVFKKLKENFGINPDNIKAFLYGYRFCLNEIFSANSKGIYYSLYNGKISHLKEKLYPGNDTKPNPIYYQIIKHFKTKPKCGCYVCLCDKGGYYQSIPLGFPGKKELGKKCPKCQKEIGSWMVGVVYKEVKPVKREKYFRIFKDDKEIDSLKKQFKTAEKLKEINKLTLEQYKENYIKKAAKNEKGVYVPTSNDFKSDEKVIRNLSPISYRLLNYILYTHLYFASLITGKNDFKSYLPEIGKTKMSWVETISECWQLLNKELLKENIDSIEKFLNYCFIDVFSILNSAKIIDKYDDLITLEDELELKIKGVVEKIKEENYKNNLIKKKNEEDITSFINLLKEEFTSDFYKTEEFPFYDYFYYSDYLNEQYINEKLSHMDENKYPVLKYYLDQIGKTDKEQYSLENLNIFNDALNLINEKYFNNISRKYAEKRKLKEEQLYINNKELIDNFIKFYNSLKLKDNNEIIKLSIDNPLKSFLIDNNDSIGNTYISIYKKFIKHQNDTLETLLDNKINRGLFDINCKNKINVQNINDNEIFTSKLPEKVSFIEILFNSSHKKILDSESRNYELYKEYEINYDLIEENLTELLLKNKKLLNENQITEFIYNNESFSNQVTNLITIFKKRYTIKNLGLHDKAAIYEFYKPNKNNIYVSKNMINDFLTLINFLNDKRKEGENKEYTEETKLYDVVLLLKDAVSNYLNKLFENKEILTINKTVGIFDYYLKLIYGDIIKDIKDYQEVLDDNTIANINKYYEKEHLITKKDLAYAIRIFITLVLVPEEEKENKIQLNNNNVINYLKSYDLWNIDINDIDFNKNLNELKTFNVKINQILSLYDTLGKDIEENLLEEVERQSKPEKEVKIIDDNKLPENSKDKPLNVLQGKNKVEEEEEEDDDDMFGPNKKDSDGEIESD